VSERRSDRGGVIGVAFRGARVALSTVPVLAACGYLYTLGLLRRKDRIIAAQIARQVRLRLWPHRYLPAVAFSAFVPGPVDVHLEQTLGTFGNVSVEELLALSALVRVSGACDVLEIGTFDGRTTLNLAANVPPDGHVYTLDLPRSEAGRTALPLDPADQAVIDKPESGVRSRGHALAARITQWYGDSATFPFGANLPQGVDLIFIDGAHTEAYVRSDSLRAIELLRGGRGIIVWHDYAMWPGVEAALHALRREDARFQGLCYLQNTSLAVLAMGDANGVG
jgi:predicted O-methyltransferase YrrM